MKKICISLFVLFLFIIGITPAFADEERYQVKCEDNKCNIYDTTDQKIILSVNAEIEKQDDIPNEEIFRVCKKENDKYQVNFYDAKNQKYLLNENCKGFIYSLFFHGIYILGKDINNEERYSLYDLNNKKLLLPFEYTKIDDFYTGYYDHYKDLMFKLRKGSLEGIYSVKDKKMILPIEYDFIIYPNSNAHKPFYFSVIKNEKAGIVDATNKIIVPIEYDNISQFNDNLWRIAQNNKLGVYDISTKKFIVPLKFKDLYLYAFNSKNKTVECKTFDNRKGIYYFSKDLFVEKRNDKYKDNKDFEIHNKGNKWGLYSKKDKKYILPIEYEDITIVRDNKDLYRVRKNDKYGIYDSNKNALRIPIKYSDISEYKKDGIFRVKQNNKFGAYDINKNLIIVPIKYDVVYSTEKDNIFIVKQNNKYGVYNVSKNLIVLPIEYDNFDKTKKEDTFLVKQNNKWGVYDINKQILIIPTIYDNVRETSNENIYIVANKTYTTDDSKPDYNCGLYDIRKKDLIVPLEYSEIQNEPNGLIKNIVYLEGENKEGGYYSLIENKIIISDKKDYNICNDSELENVYVISKKHYDKYYGLFNAQTQEIILPMKYKRIEPLIDDNYTKRKSLVSKFIICDKDNEIVYLYDYDTKKIILTIGKYGKMKPVYTNEEDFRNRYFIVSDYNSKKSYIYDIETQQQITPKVKDLYNVSNDSLFYNDVLFTNGIFMTENNIYYSTRKIKHFKNMYKNVYTDYVITVKYKKYGLYDYEGNKILPNKYQQIMFLEPYFAKDTYVSKSTVVIKNKDLLGIYDAKTKSYILPIEYNDIKPVLRSVSFDFSGEEYRNRIDKLLIFKNDKIGLFDLKNKKLVTEPIFDEVEGLSKNDDVFIVKINDKYGLYDTETKNYILEPKYYGIEKTDNDNLFILISENGKSLIDIKSNKILIPEGFVSLRSTGNDKLYIVEKNNKWGLYNTATQKLILPTKYDELSVLYHKDGKEQTKTMRMFDVEKPLKIKFDADKMKVISK